MVALTFVNVGFESSVSCLVLFICTRYENIVYVSVLRCSRNEVFFTNEISEMNGDGQKDEDPGVGVRTSYQCLLRELRRGCDNMDLICVPCLMMIEYSALP